MLELFNNLNIRGKGVIKFPEWDYVRTGLRLNLEQTNKYYRNGAYAIGSDHELIKLLSGLVLSTDMDLYQYYKSADNKALTVAQQLGFTTSISKGHVFSGVFFAQGSREVLIVTDEPFDPAEVTKNWKDARPIQVLRHGFDKLDCFQFNGTVPSGSISVFTINLPMLAVQYRAYREWQKEYSTMDMGRNSIYHFCYAYPINNMIFSSMDHAVFNRLVRVRQELPTSAASTKHPFHLTNLNARVDRLLGLINESLMNGHKDIMTIAETIPMVVNEDLSELMRLPDIPPTRQVNWGIYLARIDMLLFFLSFEEAMKAQNQTELNKFKYNLNLYLKDGTIQSAVPAELFQKQKAVIQRIVNLM